MEVHLTPEVEKQLKDFAALSGREAEEVVQDALTGYFEEAAQVRQTLDRRYDDLENGTVKPIPGDEVFARLRAKSAARRAQER